VKSYEVKIKQIMEILLYYPHYLTLDFIAQSIGLSKRSVQNYLSDVDRWIIKNGLINTKIIRKQGQGITIYANAVDKLKIDRLLSGKSLSIYSDDNRRRLDMIKKIIILNENISIRSLAEQFYVSRSTAVSDLEWVKEWLSSYKLHLIVHRQAECGISGKRSGIAVQGSEVSYRNAIAGYFDSYMAVEAGETIALNRLHEKSLQNLKKIYDEDTVEKVKRIIETTEKKFGFFLTDDYYTSLLTHIIISISRFINGNTVPPEFIPPEGEEFPVFAIETAEYIAGRLEEVFHIIVSDMEKTYICIHLVGFNALSAEQSATAEIPDKIKFLALELIKAVDSHMGTRFISDELLFFELCMHLKSIVFRLQKDVYYKKAVQFQLSDSNINIYKAVFKASNLYQEICEVKPDEEELLNITCYLLLSLHRNLRKPKVLLICNKSIIERMEFMNLIVESLPSIEIADCCTVYQLKFLTISEFDFIISTEAVEKLEKPIVDLSMVNKTEHIEFIQGFISQFTNKL